MVLGLAIAVTAVAFTYQCAETARMARGLGTDVETIRRRAADLAEANPMLGLRGCRLGIEYPEIYEMQVRAIFEGALAMAKDTGKPPPHPEVMIPLIATRREMELTHAQVDRVAEQVFAEAGQRREPGHGQQPGRPGDGIVDAAGHPGVPDIRRRQHGGAPPPADAGPVLAQRLGLRQLPPGRTFAGPGLHDPGAGQSKLLGVPHRDLG